MKRRYLKFIFIAFGIALLFAVVAGGLMFALLENFYPSPPRTHYGKPSGELEAQRQDIDYFAKLIAMDRSYSPSSRAEADRRLAALSDVKSVLPKPYFRVALMEIAALADNGHTHVGIDPAAQPMELPVRVAAFSDGIYVMHATKQYGDLLGGKLVSIDGHPIDSVMAKLEHLRGGTAQWRKLYAELYLSWLDILVGIGIAPDMSHSTWTVTSPSGANVTQTLTPYLPGKGEPFLFAKRSYSDTPLKELDGDWIAYRPDHPLPVTFTDFDKTFRRFRLPHSCVMVIQLKSSEDEGKDRIKSFLSETSAGMRANKPCQLIFDNRFNDGGDYTNVVGFARNLPNLIAPNGHIYLLISPITFSAGITTTAFIKQAGGDRVTLLGEPVGDRLAFFSEGGHGCLPNYHLCMYYETGKHDYAHPCTDWHTCFWVNWIFPVQVKTLAPDETIPMSFVDWRQGHDPVFERAETLAFANH
jgi:hypothetical protein